jgi:hypothetical protein
VPAVLFSAVLFLTENRWSQKRPYPLWLTTFGNCPLATAQPKTSRPNSLTQNAIELVITSDLIKKMQTTAIFYGATAVISSFLEHGNLFI